MSLAALAIAGCGGSSAPSPSNKTVAGIRALYRVVDSDLASGNAAAVCIHDLDATLLAFVRLGGGTCASVLAGAWGEVGHPLAASAKIVVNGRQATVYQQNGPETVLYSGGQWLLNGYEIVP